MAVEARHLENLFPYQQQLVNSNRDVFGHLAEFGALPLSNNSPSKMPHQDAVFPGFYQSGDFGRTLPVKSVDSGLTTFDNAGGPRKRAREEPANYGCDGEGLAVPPRKARLLTAVDRDIALDIRRQQSELDRLVAEQTLRMRLGIEEKVRQQSEEFLAAIRRAVIRKLSQKDEEMQRVAKLNLVLQERIQTLCVENQLLREVAQTSEAAANTLRSNLEQVLAVAGAAEVDRRVCSARAPAEEEDDAESCCGSNGGGGVAEATAAARAIGGGVSPGRVCRGCGEKESCVLLLPCRHLCLCTACGPAHRCCPACGSEMTGTVHVSMS